MLREDEQLERLARYVSDSWPWSPVLAGTSADASGAEHYQSCISCHGKNGEGNAALRSPKIGGLNPLYLQHQLEHFSHGIRGVAGGDLPGLQMKAAMTALSDAEAIGAVADYVHTLSGLAD